MQKSRTPKKRLESDRLQPCAMCTASQRKLQRPLWKDWSASCLQDQMQKLQSPKYSSAEEAQDVWSRILGGCGVCHLRWHSDLFGHPHEDRRHPRSKGGAHQIRS